MQYCGTQVSPTAPAEVLCTHIQLEPAPPQQADSPSTHLLPTATDSSPSPSPCSSMPAERGFPSIVAPSGCPAQTTTGVSVPKSSETTQNEKRGKNNGGANFLHGGMRQKRQAPSVHPPPYSRRGIPPPLLTSASLPLPTLSLPRRTETVAAGVVIDSTAAHSLG